MLLLFVVFLSFSGGAPEIEPNRILFDSINAVETLLNQPSICSTAECEMRPLKNVESIKIKTFSGPDQLGARHKEYVSLRKNCTLNSIKSVSNLGMLAFSWSCKGSKRAEEIDTVFKNENGLFEIVVDAPIVALEID